MNYTAASLLITSTAVIAFCLLAWRLTSSKSIAFVGMLGSIALLFCAYFSVAHDTRNLPLTYIVPFVIGMGLMGRSIGLYMRIKREPQLKLPASYLVFAGAISVGTSLIAYLGR